MREKAGKKAGPKGEFYLFLSCFIRLERLEFILIGREDWYRRRDSVKRV